MKALATRNAPAAIGPYSQAIAAGPWVFVSGQLGLDPATGRLADSLAGQTRQALQNVRAILAAAGLDMSHVVRCTAYLVDLSRFDEFNRVYQEEFSEPWPAREVIQAARLPREAQVEISAIAIADAEERR